ncbi:non-ribosomal peptide synthetase [Cupriavidus sp. BIS7]|uniref:non-ribosomal peptide synthetase n=1 Tax=Cupriavidus sp. BIS7 TaxID=1217718 RepID=UPI0012F6EDD8|nr:non-ribosomal peptide synthetase [Cupriavidus sp. BIS7]
MTSSSFDSMPGSTSESTSEWLHRTVATELRLDPARLGANDNLLRLGMDSMLLMAWVNRLRKHGHQVRLRDLYAAPTLTGWLSILAEPGTATHPARAGAEGMPPVTLPRMTDGEPFALTPVQHAYLVGRDPAQPLGGVGCHLYQEFLGDSGLTPHALERAIAALLARHPMLSVRFLPDGLQRWEPQPAWQRLTVHDLRDADDAEIVQHLEALRNRLGHRVLDVERGETFDCQFTLLPDGRHRLHVNLDLLVADAASFSRIFTELAALAAGRALPSALAEYDFRSYLDQWQATQAAARKAAQDWWEARLPDLPPAPALPLATDTSRASPVRMSRRQFTLDATAWRRFRTRAAACGVTPTMALATLFAATLSRWSAASRALVNLTLFDREPLHPAVDTMVADFTNILLLALEGGSDPFDVMARANQAAFTDAWEHRQWSGVEVLRALRRGDQHPHGAPIVFTSHLGRPLFGHDPDGILGTPDWGISQTPQVWLDHLAYEHGDAAILQWDANDALFPAGLVDAMFEGYTSLVRTLADGNAAAWQRQLADPMPARQHDVRRRANQTHAPIPGGCLHTPFFARATQSPDAIALIHGDDIIRYGHLASMAMRLAGSLRARGVRPGDHVAICMEKGIGQVVSALGILHAGAVYVPVAADQPRARRDTICNGADVTLVLTCANAGDADESSALTWQAAIRGEPLQPRDAHGLRDPSSPAYIIYTSGSTGTPKGVVISHTGALNTCADINQRYGVGPDDRVLGLSALHFDLSVYDIFGVLGAGGALVLVDECQRRDPGAWCDAMARHGVTLWNTVPALFDMLLTYAEGMGRNEPAGLRAVMLSGDWIGLDLPGRYRHFRADGLLVAMGGATEASIWSNVQEVRDLPPHWRSIPYGYPLANQCYRVVAPDGRDCPDWVPGELWIGGTGVALGYYNDTARTATQFVESADSRWYRTGDLGCYWPDGTLEFLGRRDRQVKVGGHRVELGEIDAALLAIPGVRNAITFAVGDRDKRLAACVVADASQLGRILARDPALPGNFAPGISRSDSDPAPAQATPDDNACVAGFLRTYLGRRPAPTVDTRYIPLMARWNAWLRDRAQPSNSHDGARRTDLTDALNGFHDMFETILSGRMPPQALLDHDQLAPEAQLARNPDMQAALATLATAIADLSRQLGRPVRLVEPYGRSGLLAAKLLERLTPAQLTYTISDPSSDYMLRLRAGLAAFPHAHVFTASKLTSTEHRHHADLVLLNNVLHRRAVPREIMLEAARLAAPGAWIHVLELTTMPAVALVTAALLEDTEVQSAQAWLTLFADTALPCSHKWHHGNLSSFTLRAPEHAYIPDAETLRERLRHALPAYMVPHRLLWLDALPLTANGKIDHQALAALTNDGNAPVAAPTQPPTSDTERLLASLWSEWLDVAAPHRDSHFFEAGGDSLLATRLIGELARRGYRGRLSDLFAAPTLAAFAATLVPADAAPPDVTRATPAAGDRHLPVPLTDVQQAYLAGRQPGFPLGGVGAHFFVEFDVADLDEARMQRAWETLILRHDMLRAVIRDGQLQVLREVPPLRIARHVVPDLDGQDALSLRTRASRQTLDPARWPTFDIQLVTTPERAHTRVYLMLDNLLLDGLSMQILLAELEQLYVDPAAPLPPIETSYRDCRLAIDATRNSCTESQRYWRARIATLPKAPGLRLAADPASIGPPRFIRLAARMAAADWQRLKARAAPLRMTPSAVLLCAFGTVLAAWSTRPAMTLNLTLFDRPPVHPHVERLLGDFTSLLLLAWTPGANWLDTAQRLQQQLWDDLPQRDYSAIRVMRDMARETGNAATTMPVVFTSALGFDGGRFLHHGSWLRPNWGISQTPQVWLDHQVYESDGDLCFNWDAVEALFPPGELAAMFDQYEALLRQLASSDAAWHLPLDTLVTRAVPLTPESAESADPWLPDPASSSSSAPAIVSDTLLRDLRVMFREIVGQPIEPDTNFFDAGASSLQLVQWHARLRQAGRTLAVTDLFAHPSPRALATHLSAQSGASTPDGPGSDQRQPRTQPRLRRERRRQGNSADGAPQ